MITFIIRQLQSVFGPVIIAGLALLLAASAGYIGWTELVTLPDLNLDIIQSKAAQRGAEDASVLCKSDLGVARLELDHQNAEVARLAAEAAARAETANRAAAKAKAEPVIAPSSKDADTLNQLLKELRS